MGFTQFSRYWSDDYSDEHGWKLAPEEDQIERQVDLDGKKFWKAMPGLGTEPHGVPKANLAWARFFGIQISHLNYLLERSDNDSSGPGTTVPWDQCYHVVWHNWNWYYYDDPGAGIGLGTHTLHYGRGGLDGVRFSISADGRVRLRNGHYPIKRLLVETASQLGLKDKVDVSVDEGVAICRMVPRINRITINGYARPGFYMDGRTLKVPGQECRIVFYCICIEFDENVEPDNKRLLVVPERRIPHACGPVTTKWPGDFCFSSISYDWALKNGYDGAAFFDIKGNFVDTTVANGLLFVTAKKIVYHSDSNDMILGFMFGVAKQFLTEAGYEVVFTTIPWALVKQCDAMITTGTAANFSTVKSITIPEASYDRKINKVLDQHHFSEEANAEIIDYLNARIEAYDNMSELEQEEAMATHVPGYPPHTIYGWPEGRVFNRELLGDGSS